MAPPEVSITAAFGEAWERMKTILFRPFDLGKWFALGFTAWLAGLASSSGGGSSSWNLDRSDASRSDDVERVAVGAGSVLRDAWETGGRWLLDHPLWLVAGIIGCGLLIALFLVILWVSSRGKFMFLDNVVHNRAEVVAPWKRYRRLGNSHFFFQLALSIVLIVFFLGLFLTFLGLVSRGWEADIGMRSWWVVLAVGIPVFLLIILTIVYIQYFLDGFVVPLMYRYDLAVMPAWSRFGEILRRHPWTLLLSGLFLFVLAIGVGLSLLAVGLMTCCVGFVILIIPYLGTVLILPVPVTYRAFTVALLDQIDPGYFPQEGPEPEVVPPPRPEASQPPV